MHKLLHKHKHKPTDARDDALLKDSKHHFRQCLGITSDREEQLLFDVIYSKKRRLVEPLYGFASDYDTSAQQYNLYSWCKMEPAQAAHLLIGALNLEHAPMLDLKLRLDTAKEQGLTPDDLIDTIFTFPNIILLTKIERQTVQQRVISPTTLLVEHSTAEAASLQIVPSLSPP
jgi:hypothetical protein